MKTEMKSVSKTISTAAVSMFLLIFLGTPAHAQLVPTPLALVAEPISPSPGQNFAVQANTPTFDKDTAQFEWTVNGKSRPDLSGLGKNSIFLTAGAVGTTVTARVLVFKDDGERINQELAVRTADLALPWYAETFIPKWYAGKALPIPKSIVDIVALPDFGPGVDKTTLIYHWTLDDEENVLSGVGNQVFRLSTSDLPNAQHHVEVTVEDQTKRFRKTGAVFIINQQPRVGIYAYSPLGGIEPRSAISYIVTQKRGLLDFGAEPFFFKTPKKDLSFRWSAGGLQPTGSPQSPNLLTIDTTGLAATPIPITLSIENVPDLFSAITRSITVLLQ